MPYIKHRQLYSLKMPNKFNFAFDAAAFAVLIAMIYVYGFPMVRPSPSPTPTSRRSLRRQHRELREYFAAICKLLRSLQEVCRPPLCDL